MKVLLYFEGEKALSKSGIGRALEHQKKALTEMGIEYTTDPTCVDYDILHINTYGLTSGAIIRKARKLNKKVIYHAHSTEEDFRNSFVGSNQVAPIVRKYLIGLYSKADYLITPTNYSKKLLENYGITVPIRVISNGIDLHRFSKNAAKEQAFKEAFHVQEGEKIVICVGLFFERKGISDFIKVAEQMPDYRFIWFGHTPLFSIPRHVRKIVTEDHPANVEFPGYIKGDIIEGAFSASDVFFFPSYEETEGIVVLEALASQQNVLVRDIPIYEDWLTNGVNCYKGNNNEEFVSLIGKIVSGELPETGKTGWKTAQERSIVQIGEELKAVYEEVLSIDEKSENRVFVQHFIN